MIDLSILIFASLVRVGVSTSNSYRELCKVVEDPFSISDEFGIRYFGDIKVDGNGEIFVEN